MKTLFFWLLLSAAAWGQIVNPGGGSGSAPSLDAVLDPAAVKAFTMGANTLNFNMSGNWGAGFGVSISSSGSNAATGPLFQVSSGASTTHDVVQFCALGTSNCVKFTSGGSFTTIGTATIDGTKLAAMTSAQLAAVLSDESGTGNVVYTDSPAFTTKVTVPAGSVTAASIVFAGDTTGGFMRQAANSPCVTNGTKCIINLVAGTPKIQMPSNGLLAFSNSSSDATTTANTSVNSAGPGLVGIGTGATQTTGLIASGMKTFVTADFTTAANTSLQTITGLSWTLPVSTAVNFSFHCALQYSQGTATAAVAFGVQGATTAPTQINASGIISTNTTAQTYGNLQGLATTTATNVVSATPSAITTIWNAYLDGTVEAPSNASPTVFNVMVSTATSGDAVTIKRGSYCALY